MDVRRPSDESNRWTRTISYITEWLGSLPAIAGSVVIVVVWAAAGPKSGFSDTWQLVINTGTTIVTFNMVFIIQNTQNRDGRAIQAKLDEQAGALAKLMDALGVDGATDVGRLVGVEEEPEKVIKDEQDKVRQRIARR
jgi:low affinity Fe/Cu permease